MQFQSLQFASFEMKLLELLAVFLLWLFRTLFLTKHVNVLRFLNF